MYSFAISTPSLLGQPLARAERRRCHDIEIPRVRWQIMRRAFDLEKHGGFDPREGSHAGYDHGAVAADAVELDFLLESISGHVAPHLLHHAFDGAADGD